MIGFAILAVYLLGFAATWRRAAWIIAHDTFGREPDGGDIGFGLFLGAIAAAFWPIIAPCYIAFRSGALTSRRGFMKPPKDIAREVEAEERERNLAEREERIARMEAEVGIRDFATERRRRGQASAPPPDPALRKYRGSV